MQNNKSLLISTIILTIGIILSSIWLGYSIQKITCIQPQSSTNDSNVFTISEVANYLSMTVEEVQGIIDTEKALLTETGSFSGKRFPYFIVNEKPYFYKEEINEWLKEISIDRREYETITKQLIY